MNGYRYLFDRNIEINYAPNDTSINYKDNTNMTSLNPVTKNKKDSNYFFPSYNTRQFKEEKNLNKITKYNSKYSTCYNYYPRKNYSKYLNYKQSSNSSSVTKNTNNQQNTTFDDIGGYNKLHTKDLIEITKRRQEIINQQKIKEQEKQKNLENNLENLDIILNENSPEKNKKYCDEGVQTSLVNNNQLDNKKEDPISTIIFTDKSALINQEITFLSIQYSVNQNNNKETSNNNSESSKDYKNTENNDFVNVDYENKEAINMSKVKDNEKNYNENNGNNSDIKEMNKTDIKRINDEQKKDDNFQNDLEFTIVNNTQISQNEENEDNNYITNGPETFQIEFNEQNQNNNYEDENFIINNNTNHAPKIFNDSLEDSDDINNKNDIDINKSKSLLNTEENEITEVEEFDQNLILLQNQSKTMSSHFENICNKSSIEKEENKINNNNNILIQDISNKENEEINLDSLNDSLSLKNKIESIKNNNNNDTENIFRIKGKKNNSLNKYQNYPNLRNLNLNANNSLCSKIYNRNNLTNNDRYQNDKNRLEKENDCLDLLKLKKSDLTSNDKEKFVINKPLKNPEFNSKESYNKSKTNLQNMKVFSQKKLNITTNENSKINISGIPICPNQSKNNINIKNYKDKSIINNENNKNYIFKNGNIPNVKNNYLITPRCMKKKRHINNYADYYKLKISMSKDISNVNTNNFININNNIS